MSGRNSSNAQAILLLTAPLIVGREASSSELLSFGEYNRLEKVLQESGKQPSDLLGKESHSSFRNDPAGIAGARLARLLERGFLLSQALDRWQARSIWVTSRADSTYPQRLRERLKEHAPPVLYGCGNRSLLESGGLAVVGSRDVSDELLRYSHEVGRLAARSSCTLVSGGARGIDQAAMRGAADGEGKSVGVLADSLERAALNGEHREYLMHDMLTFISPFDPLAGFNVGNAMQRNKIIYAISDAALVVNAEYQKGGTWAGAIEQLQKWHFVPVFVRATGELGKGLVSLRNRGAIDWPEPRTPAMFMEALSSHPPKSIGKLEKAEDLFGAIESEPVNLRNGEVASKSQAHSEVTASTPAPAAELWATVRAIVDRIQPPLTVARVGAELQVSNTQAKEWLERLTAEGRLVKQLKPQRYCRV